MNEVKLVVKKLIAKADVWGDGPLKYLQTNTAEMQNEVDKLFEKWMEFTESPTTMENAQLRAVADKLDSNVKTVAEAYQKYTKDVLGGLVSLKAKN